MAFLWLAGTKPTRKENNPLVPGPENHVMFPCVVEMQGETGACSDLQRWSAALPDQVETTLPAAH